MVEGAVGEIVVGEEGAVGEVVDFEIAEALGDGSKLVFLGRSLAGVGERGSRLFFPLFLEGRSGGFCLRKEAIVS